MPMPGQMLLLLAHAPVVLLGRGDALAVVSTGKNDAPVMPTGEDDSPVMLAGKDDSPVTPTGKGGSPVMSAGKGDSPVMPTGKGDAPVTQTGKGDGECLGRSLGRRTGDGMAALNSGDQRVDGSTSEIG